MIQTINDFYTLPVDTHVIGNDTSSITYYTGTQGYTAISKVFTPTKPKVMQPDKLIGRNYITVRPIADVCEFDELVNERAIVGYSNRVISSVYLSNRHTYLKLKGLIINEKIWRLREITRSEN